MDKILLHDVKNCGVCGSSGFSQIWNLPSLPLTEAFGEYVPDYPSFDQELLLCETCGHVQLGKQVDPNFLYKVENYQFRTLINQKINIELDFFKVFIENLGADLQGLNAIEIGASNLVMAKKLGNLFRSISVCDPLFKEMNGCKEGEISIVGTLAEEATEFIGESNIRVILGRHVLEHVLNPYQLLETLVNVMPEDSLYIFEVPSFAHLRSNLRFDAIFHQHCHYFDEPSIRRLVERLNCTLVKVDFNEDGSNGGSMLFAFKKTNGSPSSTWTSTSCSTQTAQKLMDIKSEKDFYIFSMDRVAETLRNDTSKIYGYGAAHMLSTLNYHLHGEIGKFVGILDDDRLKHKTTFKNIPITIFDPNQILISDKDHFFVTSMENRRAITRNLLGKYRNRIISSFLI